MQYLRQSTASQEISLGQFLDSTDGNTEEGGLTIANTDIKLRKHNTTTLANKNSGGATVISNGVYQTTLDATDTATAGMLEIYVHVTGALAVKSVFMILTATAFDALFTGTFNNLGGTAQTVDNNVLAAGSTGFAAIDTVVDTLLARIIGTLESGSHNPASVAQLGALTDWLNGGRLDLLLDAIPTTAMRGTDSAATSTKQNTMETTLNAIPTTPMRGTDGVDTATMRGTDSANTVVPDAAGTAATPAEVATALSDIHLDHLFATNYDPAAKPGSATAWANELVESDGGITRYTANALEQAPGGGGGTGKIGNSPQNFTLAKGTTSQIIQFSAYDSSATDGGKLTGLVFNTASLTAHYNRTGSAGSATAISLVTATKGTFTSSGFIVVDATNQPGEYELHVPNAAFASGADRVSITLKGATNLKPVTINIDLVSEIDLGTDDRVLVSANPHTSGETVADVTAQVDLLTATQASIDAIETDTGTTLDVKLNNIQGATFSTSTDSLEAIRNRGDAAWTTGAGGSSPTVEQIRIEMDDNSTKLAAILTDTGTTIPSQITALNNVAATDIVSNGAITTLSGAIVNVDLVDLTTSNTDMRGTNNAATSAKQDTMETTLNAIPTTAMRGTDNAATATALSALNNISAADVLAAGDIDGFSLEEAQKLILSSGVGILAGAATNTITIKAADGSKTRITATVDVDGNRSAVTKDVTG